MSVGFFQILLVVLLVLLLFGAGRIRTLMSELGQGVKSFKDGLGHEEEPAKKSSPKSKTEQKKKK